MVRSVFITSLVMFSFLAWSAFSEAQTNLLVNGSFETGPAIPGGSSYTTLAGGSTAITGWTVTGSTIDYFGPSWVVSDGVRAVDLDGAFSIGGIRQTFATTAGLDYRVSFDLSGNPEGAPAIKLLRVTAGDFSQDLSFDSSGQTRTTLVWQPVTFVITASDATTTLSFSSLSPSGNSWGPIVDNVRIVRELGPAPTLTSIRPASGAQGKNVFVRLRGTDFQPESDTVAVSGTGITVEKVDIPRFNSETRLTAKFLIDALAPLGAREVTVVTTTGLTSNPLIFTVRAPRTACSVSLPLTVTESRGILNINAGLGISRQTAGNWAAGWISFSETTALFWGTLLSSGILPSANPPQSRLLSARVAPAPAVAAVNAFYSPELCGFTISESSTGFLGALSERLPRAELEAILDSISLEDFDGSLIEIPR